MSEIPNTVLWFQIVTNYHKCSKKKNVKKDKKKGKKRKGRKK